MPRGRRAETEKNFDQQIAEIDAEIEDYKSKIADARQRRKALVEEKKQQDMNELLSVLAKSGKSPEELLAIFKGENGK
jgi:septal ring factor EnvC (AmiA/AmiB activator)